MARKPISSISVAATVAWWPSAAAVDAPAASATTMQLLTPGVQRSSRRMSRSAPAMTSSRRAANAPYAALFTHATSAPLGAYASVNAASRRTATRRPNS